MKKAALYVRVSTSHQIDKDSLPFQRQELANYSKYVLGIDDFEIFEDAGYSAKNTDRPKYQEMMARIRNKEFSHLLVWKIDRISRNLRDFYEMYDELKGYGITFISKNEQFDTSSAMGEAMLKIILVFAELERKLTGERVFSIMLSRAEKGLWNGTTVPLGYVYVWSKEVKFPVIDEDEAPTVQYINDLYEKLISTSKVAFHLNSEQVKTKRGGTRRLKKEGEWVVVEDNHPPIITKEQYNRVNDLLTANLKGIVTFQRSNTQTHIFSKLLYCGKCGPTFNAGLDAPRKDGYHPSRYTCYSFKQYNSYDEDRCNNFVSDITLLPFILNYISNFINLQSKITQKHSLRDIERILLRGSAFVDVLGIDKKGLEETYIAFAVGFQARVFETPEEESGISLELENLKKEKHKSKQFSS
ncbi:MAG: recombinase family protein, partial [Ruminiclostridium sp.]